MAWRPISNAPVQYEVSDAPASGYVLKFYKADTTTAIPMAEDDSGTPTYNTRTLDSDGFPTNGSGAVFIPHLDQPYRAVLFPTQAEADANDTTNAVFNVPRITFATGGQDILNELWAVDTGTANTYAIAPTPAIDAYSEGQFFLWKATNANTAASTLNVNGVGAVALKKFGQVDFENGDIQANDFILSGYVNSVFQSFVLGKKLRDIQAAAITANNALVANGTTWTSRTPTQFKSDLSFGALADKNTVAQADIDAGAIHQSQLDVSIQQASASVGGLGNADVTFTGGGYHLAYALTDNDAAATHFEMRGMIANTTYAWGMAVANTDGSARTYYWQSNYVNSSQPYTHGREFIYLLVLPNLDVIGYDLADAPPWVYNGPTKTAADAYSSDGKQLIDIEDLPPGLQKPPADHAPDNVKRKYFEDLANFRAKPKKHHYKRVELTPAMKDADMDLIPHPFGWHDSMRPVDQGGLGAVPVLLAPQESLVEQLADLRQRGHGENIGEEIIKTVSSQGSSFIKLDPTDIDIGGPKGLKVWRARWK